MVKSHKSHQLFHVLVLKQTCLGHAYTVYMQSNLCWKGKKKEKKKVPSLREILDVEAWVTWTVENQKISGSNPSGDTQVTPLSVKYQTCLKRSF